MSNNLVDRLRNWETVYPEDNGKPDGSLYLEAADALARAVDAIEEMQTASDAMMLYIARTTLAELKGQTNA